MTGIVVHDVVTHDDALVAGVRLGDIEHTLTYRLPGLDPGHESDALAIALLPHAMSRGMSLELPGRLSPRLERGLAGAQKILATWWPAWSRIEVRGQGAEPASPASEGRGTACFFTGGVDSFYSVVTELEQLEAVIFVHGFDLPLDATREREHVANRLRQAAGDLGIDLVEVESNVKDLTWRKCRWGFHAHGAALASVAQLAASRFERVLIPATHSHRHLFPWGSHALTDHLWTTDAVEIVHHGALPRTLKAATVASSAVAMRTLRCCNEELPAGALNCGHCEKCLRTMASLRICGALERCETLPDQLPLRELARLPVLGAGWEALTEDILIAAEEAGDDDLARALRRMLRIGPWRERWARWRRALRASIASPRRRVRRWVRRRRRRSRRTLPKPRATRLGDSPGRAPEQVAGNGRSAQSGSRLPG